MERTQNQAWTELRVALETLVILQAEPTATIQTVAAARIKVEKLERELAGLEQKAA
jgi:hypothetical protein